MWHGSSGGFVEHCRVRVGPAVLDQPRTTTLPTPPTARRPGLPAIARPSPGWPRSLRRRGSGSFPTSGSRPSPDGPPMSPVVSRSCSTTGQVAPAPTPSDPSTEWSGALVTVDTEDLPGGATTIWVRPRSTPTPTPTNGSPADPDCSPRPSASDSVDPSPPLRGPLTLRRRRRRRSPTRPVPVLDRRAVRDHRPPSNDRAGRRPPRRASSTSTTTAASASSPLSNGAASHRGTTTSCGSTRSDLATVRGDPRDRKEALIPDLRVACAGQHAEPPRRRNVTVPTTAVTRTAPAGGLPQPHSASGGHVRSTAHEVESETSADVVVMVPLGLGHPDGGRWRDREVGTRLEGQEASTTPATTTSCRPEPLVSISSDLSATNVPG